MRAAARRPRNLPCCPLYLRDSPHRPGWPCGLLLRWASGAALRSARPLSSKETPASLRAVASPFAWAFGEPAPSAAPQPRCGAGALSWPVEFYGRRAAGDDQPAITGL